MRRVAKFACFGIAAVAACISARAALTIYPEYPGVIERDRAYRVTVQQAGGAAREIPVYNHCEKSALPYRTRGGDVNRRFCEFAFDGGPVRIDVAVSQDVECYSVFPTSLRLRHRFRDGVISVLLDKPCNFGIRLNDHDKTILSVFADAPEDPARIPAKGDPGVLFVDGWMNPPGEDGLITVDPPVREVYIAPGAVLNARLLVNTPGALVHGRGMILDPFSNIFRYDQTKNTARGFMRVKGDNATVEDVKLIDARTFNYTSGGKGITFRNVKAMSSMMCTDGFTNSGEGLVVDGAWLYVGDNVLVVSGLKDSTYRNIVCGTSCNAVFPQLENTGITLENIDVFRVGEELIKNTYNGALRRNVKWDELTMNGFKKPPTPQDLTPRLQSFVFRNFCAVDCLQFARFFLGGNMGRLPKTFVFENLSMPPSSQSGGWLDRGTTNGVAVLIYDDPSKWLITDNYRLTITNLWVGGKPADGFAPGAIQNGEGRIEIEVVNVAAQEPLSQSPVPLHPDRTEVHWRAPAGAAGVAPAPPHYANLLAERPGTIRSVWQRNPSWLTKLDAVETDLADGARIYRLRQCEKYAGMLNVITEGFLAAGPGRWTLSFEAMVPVATTDAGGAAPGGAASRRATEAASPSATPVAIKAVFLSNEADFSAIFEVPADGRWHRFEQAIDLPFDPSVTELVALHLRATEPTEEIKFKNLSLVKARQ